MKTEKFFTHPIGVFIAAIVATFLWGSAFPFIKLSYAELGIQPQEVGEQILFAGYRFLLSGVMLLLFFKVLGKDMSFKKGTGKQLIQIGLFQTFLQYICFLNKNSEGASSNELRSKNVTRKRNNFSSLFMGHIKKTL